MAKIVDIKDLLREELIKEIRSAGLEEYRAAQILDWIYKKRVRDFGAMTNLSPGQREALKKKFYISDIEILKELVSKDGTRKFLFGLEDGQKVETVFIPSKNTNTVCVSSQVGCRFACRFCASGKTGFIRNLRPAEMVNQVLHMGTILTKGDSSLQNLKSWFENCPQLGWRTVPLSNIVFMGMGEPMDNYDNVLQAIRILNAPYGLNIGQRKITISTAGITPAIRRLSGEGLQIELSVSLHSPDDEVRSSIMAVNKKFPLKDLMAALREYIKKTNRQVTFEYVLIRGVNDRPQDAEGLAKLIKGMIAKVNVITFNPVDGLDYLAPERNAIRHFKDILDKNGVASTIRVPRGQDIDAACGQLRLRSEKV